MAAPSSSPFSPDQKNQSVLRVLTDFSAFFFFFHRAGSPGLEAPLGSLRAFERRRRTRQQALSRDSGRLVDWDGCIVHTYRKIMVAVYTAHELGTMNGREVHLFSVHRPFLEPDQPSGSKGGNSSLVTNSDQSIDRLNYPSELSPLAYTDCMEMSPDSRGPDKFARTWTHHLLWSHHSDSFGLREMVRKEKQY